jgi:hypothetical protein
MLTMKGVYFVFMILLTAFSGLTAKEPDYCRYADEVTARYTREMKEKYGLILEGSGGEFLYDIQSVSLSFRLYEKYSVDQIRVIIVNAEKRLMEMLNDDKKIRPYLRNFPVTPVNATISLSCHDLLDDDRGLVDAPYIAFTLCVNGKVFYRVNLRDPSGWKINYPNYKLVHQETFEEACRIVEKQASTEK